MGFNDFYKQYFQKGSITAKLIAINLVVFLIVNIFNLYTFLFTSQSDYVLVEWFAVPASFKALLLKPWTPFTYMFLHADFLHILFNMLWLFWFAQLFTHFFDQKRLLGTYILGGLSGAAFYILMFNIFPVFQGYVENSIALGASASVMAVVIAVCVYVPDFALNLLFFGPVKLKWIGIITIVIDLISIPSSNAGGHIAHLGGAAFGVLFALQTKNGKDITKGFNRMMDSIVTWFKPSSKMKVSYKQPHKQAPGKERPKSDYEYNKSKQDEQAEIDRILDKISKYGYDALTKQEKATLFKMSDKDK